MDVDTLMLNWKNLAGLQYQHLGTQYHYISKWLDGFNEMGNFSELYKNMGDFFIEKGKPIHDSEWFTKNSIVYEEDKAALLKFSGTSKGTPIVIVAPEAGHNSKIADYGPEQSLVQCALKNYDGEVYVVSKRPSKENNTQYALSDAIQTLKNCITHIGRPVHLIGLCQGGWQSTIYTATFPLDVKSLTLAAAPIDFHKGDSIITQWAKELPLSFFESMVKMGGGNMPGGFIVFGFMMLNPFDRFLGDDLTLFQNIENQTFLDRHHRFNEWYHVTQPLSGKFYLDVVQKLFKENQLINGKLEVLGKTVDLSRIDHPLFLIAGEKDDITPPVSLFAIEDHIRSKTIIKETVSSGHIGVFMAKKVIKTYWTQTFKTLSEFG